MNYAERRKNLRATRDGGLTFEANLLPASMSLEHINMLVALQAQAREPHEGPADIVIPTRTGEMLSSAAYKLDQQARPIQQNVIAEIAAFRAQLRTERKETVENWDDEDFIGMINGVRYGVPKRGRKQLPSTLAIHFRDKKGLRAKGEAYEARMGMLRDGDAPEKTVQEFEQAVRSFDETEYERGTEREEIF